MTAGGRVRWFSGRAIGLHVTVLVTTTLCLVAGWWQVGRALSGNVLSYFYAVEWPIFSVLAVWGWWQLVHTGARGDRAGSRSGPSTARREQANRPASADPRPLVWDTAEETERLRAYNRYLRELHATGQTARRGRASWDHD